MTRPLDQTSRALMPDYLRLVALFGIVVVNVQYIAFSALHGFADPVAETARDAITLWLVNGLALFKTYGLFSFMFGVGLGFLMRSAARRGLPFGRVYRNRMIGLLILGIAHGCLFFPGDIPDHLRDHGFGALPVAGLAGAPPAAGRGGAVGAAGHSSRRPCSSPRQRRRPTSWRWSARSSPRAGS